MVIMNIAHHSYHTNRIIKNKAYGTFQTLQKTYSMLIASPYSNADVATTRSQHEF